MGGFVAKAKGGPGKDEGPNSLKADMMEDEAEDSEDEEHQMEKDALRAMEVGGRESLAAAYEAMAAKEVVYDTFSDELRAGYLARVQAREAWCEEVETSHEQREARDKALLSVWHLSTSILVMYLPGVCRSSLVYRQHLEFVMFAPYF
ncbi:unnamed protein product [Symbiodinium sp. CCMP2456]|nr:unnamed protein product [Symbiodinium sp. CCMP2456]